MPLLAAFFSTSYLGGPPTEEGFVSQVFFPGKAVSPI